VEDKLKLYSDFSYKDKLFRAFHGPKELLDGKGPPNKPWPSEQVLAVPGDKICLDFSTASNYSKASDEERYGFGCTIKATLTLTLTLTLILTLILTLTLCPKGFKSLETVSDLGLWRLEQEIILMVGRIANSLCGMGKTPSWPEAEDSNLFKNGISPPLSSCSVVGQAGNGVSPPGGSILRDSREDFKIFIKNFRDGLINTAGGALYHWLRNQDSHLDLEEEKELESDLQALQFRLMGGDAFLAFQRLGFMAVMWHAEAISP